MQLIFTIAVISIAALNATPIPHSNIAPRIVNGKPALENQFPWQVSIKCEDEKNITYCGGSIISNEWILTGAQCLAGFSNFTIGLGSNKFSQPNITLISNHSIPHPDYGTYLVNDIALIKLPQSINFTDSIKKVNLPSIGQSGINFDGMRTEVSGWGSISDEHNGTTEDLMYADLRVITNNDCSTFYGSMIVAQTICAKGSQGKNICAGDIGGPLVVYEGDWYTQIGIASFIQSCNSNNPSGFARLPKFLDWISKETGIEIRP